MVVVWFVLVFCQVFGPFVISDFEVFMEGLILAQDERWRRA